MGIQFKKRNEDGLHCRFCEDRCEYGACLYETSPVKGIVCQKCMEHLFDYIL